MTDQLINSSLPTENPLSQTLSCLGGKIYGSSQNQSFFEVTKQKQTFLFGAIQGREVVTYKSKFEEGVLEKLVARGPIGSEPLIDSESLFHFLEEYEHIVKRTVFGDIKEILASEETNPYLATIKVITEERARDKILFQAEIDHYKLLIENGIAELAKKDKINSQQENRLDHLKAELEKFKPYLDSANENLDWEVILNNGNKLFIQDTSSLTIKELKSFLAEKDLLIEERTKQLFAMQIELVTLRDELAKVSNSVEIIEQEKQNSYQLYQKSEILNQKLTMEVERNSDDFRKVTFQNTKISNENLTLKKFLEIQTLVNSESKIIAESLVQKTEQLELELQKSKDDLLTLRESHFVEKIKTNVLLALNVSTSLVPGQTYGRIVQAFQTSMLASRVFNSPIRESNQWFILTLLCVISFIYNIYRIAGFLCNFLLNFWKRICKSRKHPVTH